MSRQEMSFWAAGEESRLAAIGRGRDPSAGASGWQQNSSV